MHRVFELIVLDRIAYELGRIFLTLITMWLSGRDLWVKSGVGFWISPGGKVVNYWQKIKRQIKKPEDPPSKNQLSTDIQEFALLGRSESGAINVLAFTVENSKVLCLFETAAKAEAFSRLCSDIREESWRVLVMKPGKLADLVEDFDYVTINPSPHLDSKRELIDASGFARSLKHWKV